MAGPRKPHTKTTSERGLGHQHQERRRRLLAAHVEGTICPFFGIDPKCPGPMYSDQDLDADHSTPRDGGRVASVADRLAHRPCNTRAGQRMSVAIQQAAQCPWHDDCGSWHSRAW